MGLDVTHNCWRGSYSKFYQFRKEIERVADIKSWESIVLREDDSDNYEYIWDYDVDGVRPREGQDPLIALTYHSDCEGYIHRDDAEGLVRRLREIVPDMEEHWRPYAIRFAEGAQQAVESGEDIEFH
jgi:hypothetical protein